MESSTSNQNYSSDEIEDEMLKFDDVGQMVVDRDGVPQNENINPKIVRKMLAAAVIRHDLPQSFVEYEGYRDLMKCLCPDPPFFSRKDIVSEINKIYLKEKAKLKRVLANIQHRVCLTLDVLTACINKNECYICLAARFVDENWKLNCKILNFDRVDSPEVEGIDLAAKIGDFLMEWGINGKVFSLTSDNASRNDTMQDILKKRLLLDNNLLCGGEFFRGHCLADTLNLIVQNGLQLCDDILFKIRKSVMYLNGSESRRKRFADCVSQFSDIDTSVDLRLDVCTSWNLTFLMLDVAIKYKKAFDSFRLVEQDYDQFCPTNEEWNRGEKVFEFLKPYYGIYNLICKPSLPTSNLYFAEVWMLEMKLKKNLSNEDATISGLCGSMIEKFDKYWNEYSMILTFGAILDPRVKLQALEFLYSKVESDSTKCQEKISLVKSMLYKLFEEYKNASKSRSSQLQSSSPPSPKRCKSFLDDYFESQRQLNAGKSQLDLYLTESNICYSNCKDLDLLEYWKNQSYQWPDLALMACDVLAFPITTVAMNSGFSIGGHLLTKYSSCLVPKNIQDLICTRNWLYGFVSNDDDDDDECLRTKTTLSDEGSNDCESEDSDEGSDGWKSVDS